MTHLLDQPVWSALTSDHAHLALGGGGARRYRQGTSLFAASDGDAPEALSALGDLVGADEAVVIVQAASIVLPETLVAASQTVAMQMVLEREPEPVEDARIVPLGSDDVADMVELVDLTRPGPFAPGALELGRFWGIRQDGRLIAMAGERLRQTGWTEMSGVCSHPDMRGQGLGRLMSRFVSAQIVAEGRQAYLHAYETNALAIALYERLGYRLRARMNVTVARRAG